MNEPVIAYRTWDVRSGLLVAVGIGPVEWTPAERMTATCLFKPGQRGMFDTRKAHIEPAPVSSCDCGIYAFKDLPLVVDHLRPGRNALTGMVEPRDTKRVAGRVALWGSIVECERGYKAQYAYPQVLYYTDDNEAMVRELSQKYHVDAVPMPAAILDELAKPVPDPYAEYRMNARMMISFGGSIFGGAYADAKEKREKAPWDWKHGTAMQLLGFVFEGPRNWYICRCGHSAGSHSSRGLCLVRSEPEKSFSWCSCERKER